jgi:hypothetical protein
MKTQVREREDAFASTFATANPSFGRRDARTQAGKLRATLGFWWCGGFCGFAGFRRCGAGGCWTTGKIFIRNGEDFVLDE